VQSRSYEVIREGRPIYIVLHRPGDEVVVIQELRDHIFKQDLERGQLPVFESAETILPPSHVWPDAEVKGSECHDRTPSAMGWSSAEGGKTGLPRE
jgi:hypothetical protein